MTLQTTKRLFTLLTALLLPLSSSMLQAQEQVRVTFTGFVQAIAQYGSEGDYIKVGHLTAPYDHRTTKMGIRRGRLAAIASYGDLAARVDVNATDQKISIFNVYAEYKPHWAEGAYVKGGLMTPSFGYELPYSSSRRAAFERSHYMADLFPGDIDMGLEIGYKGALDHTNRWRLESTLSILSGNADKGMNKNLPDLALRLALTQRGSSHDISFGLSGYAGSVPTQGEYYAFDKGTATLQKDRMLRTYGGAFINTTLQHHGGALMLTAEGIMGLQPGWQNANLAVGPKAPATVENNILIQRPFVAGMAQLVERLKPVDLEFFGRYAYYDRNRQFDPKAEQELKLSRLTARTEGRSHQISTGVNYFLQQDHLRLSLQYDCFLRQQLEQQTLIAAKPLHMVTIGAQYKF
ncbi:MAG: porin [Porphyromonas sp.]|uniref:porin n=1 Tax=Porphyromonas sp. TaxID=1924944 RepID=UPI001A6011C3|nr:porin [Porphyromonas sp.]MBL6453588.1 porin [Porphyromonas sp.]